MQAGLLAALVGVGYLYADARGIIAGVAIWGGILVVANVIVAVNSRKK